MTVSDQQHTTIRIGCASAFWGDTETAAAQLLQYPQLDYLVFDYLAEVTLSIMATARAKNPQAGYALDFVSQVMKPLLAELKQKGVRVISNAGGMNPLACRDALLQAATEVGVSLNVAVVLGDDLMPRQGELQQSEIREMFNGSALPEELVSVNAYLGAPAISQALAAGADVVITGRIVDSAVVTGALVHEFGWQWQDYDRLAQASLAGHLIECGAQCTGGNFTDWASVPDYEHIGFPVIECHPDGSFVVTKPDNTGGLVSTATVAEQLVYEIGNPAEYLLPDVTCDFTTARLEQLGPNRVGVCGARGKAPGDCYKVSATYRDGFRSTATFMLGGIEARAKAQRVAEAIINRTREIFTLNGWGNYQRHDIEIIGTEATYGSRSKAGACREVLVKIAVSHDNKAALALFSREIAQAATGMAPGITGFISGRPGISPIIRLFSFLLPKAQVNLSLQLTNRSKAVTLVTVAEPGSNSVTPQPEPQSPTGTACSSVPLIKLAWARSGDKGNHANIGVIARDPGYLPWIAAALTEEAVTGYMAQVLDDPNSRVQRWYLPGIQALNFLLENSLGGGGMASLRIDPQGKAFAQQLLEFPIPVPDSLTEQFSADGENKY